MAAFFLYRIPMIVSQILPASTLLTALMTYGYLSRHSEIVAIKANGISLYRLSLPVLTMAVLISLFIFFLNEWITPYSNQKSEHIRLIEVQKRQSLGSFKQDQIWYRGQKGIYNFKLFDVQSNRLRGITIYHMGPEMSLSMRIDAEWGEWLDGRWQLHNVLVTRFKTGEFPLLENHTQYPIDLPENPDDFKIVQKNVETMGYTELKRYIRKLQSEGFDTTRYMADLHGKIAFPLVCIILAVIGMAFSLRSERSGGVAQGIGVGLLFGFSYWLVFAFGISLGRSGAIPPLPAAWLGNIFFSVISAVLLYRIKT
jgi:lipopolysaccharide export system permease protein